MTGHGQIPSGKDQAALPIILVVEHDLTLNLLLVDALHAEFDCVVHALTTGRSALETAQKVEPDLLIIDYELLDMDVTELADQLHGIKQIESIPTIIINSHAASWSKHQGYFVNFLRKPFHLYALYEAVRKAFTSSVNGRESSSEPIM